MKILQINKYFDEGVGGIETVVHQVATILNCDVLACRKRGRRSEEVSGNYKVFRAKNYFSILSLPISFDFFKLYKQIAPDYDIVILHHPFPLGFLAAFLFSRKQKLVVWYHSDIVRQKITGYLIRPLLIKILMRATFIIVADKSIYGSSRLLSNYESKIRVFPFAVRRSILAPSQSQLINAANIRKIYQGRLILTVGRFVYYKGYEFLVRAMKRVEAKLLMIGDGPLMDEVKQLIITQKLTNRIEILPYVSDLTPYYQACDIFVLPSISRAEAFGIVQIEAMALSKPVINTKIDTAVPQVSVNGITGITVPPGDENALAHAMNELLKDEELRLRYGQAAKQRVMDLYTEEVFSKNLNSLLVDL